MTIAAGDGDGDGDGDSLFVIRQSCFASLKTHSTDKLIEMVPKWLVLFHSPLPFL